MDPKEQLAQALATSGRRRGPITTVNPTTNVTISAPRSRGGSTASELRLIDAMAKRDVLNEPMGYVHGGSRGAVLSGLLQGISKSMRKQGANADYDAAVAEVEAQSQAQAQAEAQAAEAKRLQEIQDKRDQMQWEWNNKPKEGSKGPNSAAEWEHARANGYTGTYAEWMGKEDGEPKIDVDGESKFTKDFNALTKDYASQNDAFGRIVASVDNPTAAGDLALIFNYMKLLDPGSTVREGEFAQAAASGGYGDRLKAAGESLISGKRLSEAQRADFLARSQRLYTEATANFDARRKREQERATAYGYDGERTVPDRALYRDYEPPSASPPPSVADGATATNPETGEKIQLVNGQWVAVQ